MFNLARVIRRRGFSLVELLVVVAVITILMAILMPSLAGARKLAKTAKCAAQLRQIDLAMQSYAQEFRQAILGNAHTSGAFLLQPGYDDNNCPNICQAWDWMSPTAKQMGLQFNEGPLTTDRVARYTQLVNHPAFRCSENDILATEYTGPGAPKNLNLGTTLTLSYNTASVFQYENGTGDVSRFLDPTWVTMPGYRPKLSLVGNPSSKIYIADGARWSSGPDAPSVELGYLGSGSSLGGHFADYGPWARNTGATGDSYTRSYAKPNGIIYAMRHGSRTPNSKLKIYRFNAAFFDGHVETMDGLTSANPALWVPSGAFIKSLS